MRNRPIAVPAAVMKAVLKAKGLEAQRSLDPPGGGGQVYLLDVPGEEALQAWATAR